MHPSEVARFGEKWLRNMQICITIHLKSCRIYAFLCVFLQTVFTRTGKLTYCDSMEVRAAAATAAVEVLHGPGLIKFKRNLPQWQTTKLFYIQLQWSNNIRGDASKIPITNYYHAKEHPSPGVPSALLPLWIHGWVCQHDNRWNNIVTQDRVWHQLTGRWERRPYQPLIKHHKCNNTWEMCHDSQAVFAHVLLKFEDKQTTITTKQIDILNRT